MLAKFLKRIGIVCVVFCLHVGCLFAERRPIRHYLPYETVFSQTEQQRILSYLADDQARGRMTGTWANEMVATYIRHEMESYGLLPFRPC